MSRFLPEPAYRHGTPAQTAVVLINLGTPDAPTPQALRRYLREFLSDPRVVELPRAFWLPLLHGVILNTRPAKSAAKYASIWTPDGSPLLVHTERQAKFLQGLLGERGIGVKVAWAMRYGNPSVGSVLSRLKRENVQRILLLPAYPQYAASTSGSVMDAVASWLQTTRNQPEIRHIRAFADHPGYIAALAQSVRDHWMSHPLRQETWRLVLSFHGTPRQSLDQGDPYFCECMKTSRLVREALGLSESQCLTTFQSRFGRSAWLQPYTAPTVTALAKEGVERVDILCPGFIGDCLETLEEIAMEVRADFLAAGGRSYHYIPCLNERPDWISALADLVGKHLAGWERPRLADEALAAQQQRALALGAKR